jgi:osmotically-inducible protein OsmY
MKTDSQVQHDVMAELEWEPSVDHADIGVAVSSGVVTLSGTVASYAEKLAAEKAARRVEGVKALAEEITVRHMGGSQHSDTEIAERIIALCSWNVIIPHDRITIKVEKGLVTLGGTVDWYYQARAAADAAGEIDGVIGVINAIAVRQLPVASSIRDRIVAAIRRQAESDATSIKVETKDGVVTLTGQVKAWHERQVAEQAAWSAPGVTKVEDNILVTA